MSTTKTTTTTEVKSHGAVRVTEPEPERKRWIPRALQKITVIQTGNATYEEEIANYGLWKVRALRTCRAYGHQVEIGETFELPGNNALNFCLCGDVEFVDIDGRKAREDELDRAAKALGAPVDYQTAPQFSQFPDPAPIKKRF
jgi:hypothetical protein